MTPQDKKTIIAYLSGPRDYFEGVALYNRHGQNLMLKRRFALDQSETTKVVMLDALRRLAGLTEAEFAALPRLAKTPDVAVESPHEGAAPAAGTQNPAPVRASEISQRMVRFRERFPFLDSPDCPDILKILVADMFTAYGNYKTARAHLEAVPDETIAEAAADCEQVVEGYLANREIWDELEYYKEHGEILGRAAKFREIEVLDELAALSDVDLMKKLASARVNVSKNKSLLADLTAKGADTDKAAAQVEAWTAKKMALEAEVERRKKK